MRRVAFVVPVLLLAASACDAPELLAPTATPDTAPRTFVGADSTAMIDASPAEVTHGAGGIMIGSGS